MSSCALRKNALKKKGLLKEGGERFAKPWGDENADGKAMPKKEIFKELKK